MMKMNRKALLRAARRGVTLIEILIVLAIVGLIAGGVAVVAVPKYQQAQKDTAKTGARTVYQNAQAYLAEHSTEGCPTTDILVQKKQLDAASNTKDPWNNAFKIVCSEENGIEVSYVASFGPDGKENTADDIRIPEAPGAAGK